ncbi:MULTISPECIES: hypothetical protein [unclassified Clostridium]|uniref:hypothetical protein n=1 Tax=unclassified Clostridium TaxID=2614128 RepID=UPI00207B0739|nr:MULTISPECIES: hypothetical protein [unclassified Clostridium]
MNCGCGIPLECPKCKEKLYRKRKIEGAYIIIERVCQNSKCDYIIREAKIFNDDVN